MFRRIKSSALNNICSKLKQQLCNVWSTLEPPHDYHSQPNPVLKQARLLTRIKVFIQCLVSFDLIHFTTLTLEVRGKFCCYEASTDIWDKIKHDVTQMMSHQGRIWPRVSGEVNALLELEISVKSSQYLSFAAVTTAGQAKELCDLLQ